MNEKNKLDFKDKLDSQASRFNLTCNRFCSWQRVGSLIVLCRRDGKLYTLGPHWPGVVVIIGMIIGGTLLNLQILQQRTTLSYQIVLLIKIFIYLMMILTTLFLLLTALADPGVELSNQVSTNDEEDPNFNVNIDSDVSLDGNQYCDICDVYQARQLNVRHCDACNVCIRGHDHHCPWMGKCIGQDNMRYFILFNISWVVYIFELMLLAIMT